MKTKRKRDESPQRAILTKRTYNKKRRRHAKETSKETISVSVPEDKLQYLKSTVSVPSNVNLANCYNLTKGHCELLRNDWLQQIISLNLECCHSLTDDDFSTLFGFQPVETNTVADIRVLEPLDDSTLKLESLNLTRTNIGDAGVAAIAIKCKNLKHLYLSHTRITDLSLSLIAQHCSNLQTLEVVGCDIGNYGLQLIAQECKSNLLTLDVSDCGRVNDAIVPYLCFYCPNLERLGLRNTKIPDRGVSALLRKLKLTALNIEGLPITDIQLCQISHFQPSLKELNLSFCYNASLKSIKTVIELCKDLTDVHLYGLGIGNDLLEELRREKLSIFSD